VAQYLALYTENTHLKKCLITLTPEDGKIATTLQMRKEFFKKLNRYKMRFKDETLQEKSIKKFKELFVNEL
jgi:hypothetical protein